MLKNRFGLSCPTFVNGNFIPPQNAFSSVVYIGTIWATGVKILVTNDSIGACARRVQNDGVWPIYDSTFASIIMLMIMSTGANLCVPIELILLSPASHEKISPCIGVRKY